MQLQYAVLISKHLEWAPFDILWVTIAAPVRTEAISFPFPFKFTISMSAGWKVIESILYAAKMEKAVGVGESICAEYGMS